MTYETVLLEKSEGIGTLTMNRPHALNALNGQMVDDLDAALTDLELDPEIRVIVLTGAGRAFSAGRDLKDIGKPSHRTGADVWARFESIGKPTIAAVNGLCYTGALSMLICCDLAVAAEEAVFADTHTKYGMVHGGGQSQRLRDRVGALKAKEIIFTCEPIPAAEAARIGLVSKVVPAADLMPAVRDLAQKIARNDAAALATAKHLINEGAKWGTAVGLELEATAYKKQRREQSAAIKTQTERFFGRTSS